MMGAPVLKPPPQKKNRERSKYPKKKHQECLRHNNVHLFPILIYIFFYFFVFPPSPPIAPCHSAHHQITKTKIKIRAPKAAHSPPSESSTNTLTP